jgi:hypothetical protein
MTIVANGALVMLKIVSMFSLTALQAQSSGKRYN